MAKSDINLFRAAGGERAKASKRSPVSIMLLIGLVVIVAALGVAVYFNLKVNTAQSDYDKKLKIQANYERTIADEDVKELSAEYKTVVADINSASAINAFVETRSALYPEATMNEVKAVHDTILSNSPFSINEKVEAEEDEEESDEGPLPPIDFAALRAYLYSDEMEAFPDRELFYYALQKLADKQAEDDSVNVWYAYYRCYFVAVFTGDGESAVVRLISDLANPYTVTMGGQAPFSVFGMKDTEYGDQYPPAKHKQVYYEGTYYQILLLPMKTVIERAFDILSAHADAIAKENGWESEEQKAEAKFGVQEISFTNEDLTFNLILPESASLKGYMAEFDASYFFEVASSVKRPGSGTANGGISYEVILKYKNRPEIETVDNVD